MTKRLLILFSVLAFAFSFSGGARTLHHLFDHAPGAGSSGCAEAQVCDSSSEKAPPTDEPAPTPDPEDDCPVCHTLATAKQSFTTPDVFTVTEAPTLSVDAPLRRVVPANQRRWSTGPARAPPVTA